MTIKSVCCALLWTLPLLLVNACRTSNAVSSNLESTGDSLAKMQAFFAKDRIVEIRMKASSWDQLRNEEPMGGHCNFEWIGARYNWYNFEEMTVDGITFTQVGARKKSYCGSISSILPSMNIDFAQFNEGQKKAAKDLMGTDRMVLNNSTQDPSFIRQCLAYQVFKDFGIPAPHCNFAHVIINDQDRGIYVNVQPMRKDFIGEIYGKNLGQLYEINKQNFRSTDLKLYEANRDSYGDVESSADILGVIGALAPEGSFEKIQETVDVEQFTLALAADIVLANWDGFFARLNNGYIYFAPQGKMQSLPWGPDKIMSRASVDGYEYFPLGTAGNRLLAALAQRLEWREDLIRKIDMIAAQHFQEKAILARIDTTVDKISAFVLPRDRADFQTEVSALKRELNLRAGKLAKLKTRLLQARFPIKSRTHPSTCWGKAQDRDEFVAVSCDLPGALQFNLISIDDMRFHIETSDKIQCLRLNQSDAASPSKLSLGACSEESQALWVADKTDARRGSPDTALRNGSAKEWCLSVQQLANEARLVAQGDCFNGARPSWAAWIDGY